VDDLAAVEALLGRRPQGAFEVVVRDPDGSPVVVRNAPLLDDGTPMPTRYWLAGRRWATQVGRIEADGGVRRAEAEIDPKLIAAAHERYAAERDAAMPADHSGPSPSGGVGGTRVGVKCLHAHLAWWLAGGDDPVGAWVAEQVKLPPMPSVLRLDLLDDAVHACLGDALLDLPCGLTEVGSLIAGDPPQAMSLTNAIGTVFDHLDDLIRELPGSVAVDRVAVAGPVARTIAAIEVGHEPDLPLALTRDAAEEVFRTVVTERRSERALNPGLTADHLDVVIAGCCTVVAIMRHLHLDEIDVLA
jgi:uncharacterized protein